MRYIVVVMLLGMCVCGCKRETAPAVAQPALPAGSEASAEAGDMAPPAAPAPPEGADGAGIDFTTPEAWIAQEPSSAMRYAQYAIPGEGGQGATLVVYYFGTSPAGSVAANIDRWCRQFVQADGSASRDHAVVEQASSNGLDRTTIWLTGRYVAQTMPGSGVRVDHPEWALLGAIVQTPHGPYYFKAVGPEATLAHARDAFTALLDSIETR